MWIHNVCSESKKIEIYNTFTETSSDGNSSCGSWIVD